MSIRSKLVFGFGVFYLLLFSVGWVSFNSFKDVNTKSRKVFDYTIHLDEIINLRHEIKQLVFVYKLYLAGKRDKSLLDRYDVDLKISLKRLKSLPLDTDMALLVKAISDNHRSLNGYGKDFRTKIKRDIPLAIESDEVIFDHLSLLLDQILYQSNKLNKISKHRLLTLTSEAEEQQRTALSLIILVNGVALLIAIICAFILGRSILKPIKNLRKGIRAATQGNWKNDIPVSSKDELGQLSTDFNHMMSGFKAIQSLLKGKGELPLDQFMKSITLDLNNVLSAILGVVVILKSSLKDNAEALKQLDVVIQAAEQGTHLSNKLRLYSDDEAPGYVELSMADLVTDCSELLRRTQDASISISEDSSDDLWTVCAHRASLMNVILNLGINACESMPQGGQVQFKIRNLTIKAADKLSSLVDPGDYNWLVITDSGGGMPDHVLKKAFEPFFTTKEVGNRAGLGLTLSLEIVRSFGGEMYIDSVPTKGTSMHVFIPAVLDAQSSSDLKDEIDA